MWIAVAVVVVVIISAVTLSYLLRPKPSKTDVRNYEVTLDVSETDDAWYVNITDIDGGKDTDGSWYYKHEELKEQNITSLLVGVVIQNEYKKIIINAFYDLRANDTFTERYGIKWIDKDPYNSINKGDSFVFLKEGGTEFTAEKNDEIYLEYSPVGGEGINIDSNSIKLP